MERRSFFGALLGALLTFFALVSAASAVTSTTTAQCAANYAGGSPLSVFARCTRDCCVDFGGTHNSTGGLVFGGANCTGAGWGSIGVALCIPLCLPACPLGLAPERVAQLESGGALWSAQCARLGANLSGSDVVPPVVTDVTGVAVLDIDLPADHFPIGITAGHAASDLTDTTAVEIRLGAVGAEGPPIFEVLTQDLGIRFVDLNSSNFIPQPGNGVSTLSDAKSRILSGDTYLEVRTLAHPDGEIRGQITILQGPPILVPTLSEWGLIVLGFMVFTGGVVLIWRRRRLRELSS